MTRSGSPAITFVGELNPHGSDPRWALHPEPRHLTGGRLCRVLGLDPDDYLETYGRVNLCAGRWERTQALRSCVLLQQWNLTRERGHGLVLLGGKVAETFGLPSDPFRHWQRESIYLLTLPHPSGLCRLWNDPENVRRARRAFRQLQVDLSVYPGFRD